MTESDAGFPWQRAVRAAAWTLTVLSAALLAVTITAHVRKLNAGERDARAQARAKAVAAARLIVGSKPNERVAATGFKVTDILKAAVSLLFPALVAQVNLRSKVGASDIIYIEYFYFILYVAILAVAGNALTFTLSASGVSQVRDNLIPKLLFWPVTLGACFAVTLYFLY